MNNALKTIIICIGCFIVGLAIGVLLSPVKNGVIIGSQGVTINNKYDSDEFSFEEDENWNEDEKVK